MTIHLSPDVSCCQADDVMILLHVRTGRYWQLNATGSSILAALIDDRAPIDIAANLAGTTTADVTEIAADIDRLVDQLAKARLVEIAGSR